MSERDTGDVGCARRRRERRLRACHRHGPTTLAMELATALHPQRSRPELKSGGGGRWRRRWHSALRGVKTRLPGRRPGTLTEPEPLLAGERAACPRSWTMPWTPSLVALWLADDEEIDQRAVQFLLTPAILVRKEEEQEERKWKDEEKREERREKEEEKEKCPCHECDALVHADLLLSQPLP